MRLAWQRGSFSSSARVDVGKLALDKDSDDGSSDGALVGRVVARLERLLGVGRAHFEGFTVLRCGPGVAEGVRTRSVLSRAKQGSPRQRARAVC